MQESSECSNPAQVTAQRLTRYPNSASPSRCRLSLASLASLAVNALMLSGFESSDPAFVHPAAQQRGRTRRGLLFGQPLAQAGADVAETEVIPKGIQRPGFVGFERAEVRRELLAPDGPAQRHGQALRSDAVIRILEFAPDRDGIGAHIDDVKGRMQREAQSGPGFWRHRR